MGKCNSLLWLLLAMPFVAFATTNEMVITRDEQNTPYARAIRAGEAKDWERFRYWVGMVPENERDVKIKDLLSRLVAEVSNPKPKTKSKPKSKPKLKPKDMPYIGPINYYSVQEGDTLLTICKSSNVSQWQLRQLNGLENDSLQVGQKLLVPVSINSKCQVRIAAYTLRRDNGKVVKEYMTVNPTSAELDGIMQHWYHRDDGVFDLLLCSDTSSDDMVAFKVRVNGEDKTIFVQIQEGINTMEVEVQ